MGKQVEHHHRHRHSHRSNSSSPGGGGWRKNLEMCGGGSCFVSVGATVGAPEILGVGAPEKVGVGAPEKEG